MYYRQKILLSLVEICGRKMTNTDLEKLLFLYCKTAGKNHYDFFPYKFGAFSYVSYYDKRKLIEKGYLKNVDYFELTPAKSYVRQLKVEDQKSLREFVENTQNMRGKRLVKKTYVEFPEYASRSEIAQTVFTNEELRQTEIVWNKNKSDEPTLFTIGYEGISIDEYIYRLIQQNTNALIDVRKNPLSRKHGFSKKSLASYLQKANIAYYHIPDLGIPSHLRKDLNGDESYATLFDYYAKNILPLQSESMKRINVLLEIHKRVALTCFEADHAFCHRHKITEAFEADNAFNHPIVHL